MAAIDQYIERIPNTELQEQIREEVARLTKKKRFGLVTRTIYLIMYLCQR